MVHWFWARKRRVMDTGGPMKDHSTITPLPLAPAVRFEPCLAFHADLLVDLGVCAGCGWPTDDHDAPAQAA